MIRGAEGVAHGRAAGNQGSQDRGPDHLAVQTGLFLSWHLSVQASPLSQEGDSFPSVVLPPMKSPSHSTPPIQQAATMVLNFLKNLSALGGIALICH